jgi:dihydrofolate reductase
LKKIIISAISKNGVIGRDGDLPWHNKEEFNHFKKTTIGFPMIMGRKTFDSLKVPLKDRLHIIVTKNIHLNYSFKEVKIFHSIKDALQFCEEENFEKIFIIGGGEIYRQTINIADELCISIMKMEVEGDTYFPEIDKNIWKEKSREEREEFDIVTYVKR